jgi:hypothetical protein
MDTEPRLGLILPFRGAAESAPEWTRTTTDHAVHKALNPIRPVQMGPGASRSSSLRGFLDALDGLDDMDVATMLPRVGGVSASNDRSAVYRSRPWRLASYHRTSARVAVEEAAGRRLSSTVMPAVGNQSMRFWMSLR